MLDELVYQLEASTVRNNAARVTSFSVVLDYLRIYTDPKSWDITENAVLDLKSLLLLFSIYSSVKASVMCGRTLLGWAVLLNFILFV